MRYASKTLFKIATVLMVLALQPMRLSYAQEQHTGKDNHRGRIIEIIEESQNENGDNYQKLKLLINGGKEIVIENEPQFSARNIRYKVGDSVMVQKFSVGVDNDSMYIITDFYRTGYLTFVLAVLIGKKYGLYSIVGMGFSFFMIFKFILPQIISGKNPIISTIAASMFIIPVTFYLSHGFNKKTHTAIVSTIITLIFTSPKISA